MNGKMKTEMTSIDWWYIGYAESPTPNCKTTRQQTRSCARWDVQQFV